MPQKQQVAICLFRAINVGGNYPVEMRALRALFEELGYSGAQTFIQSGNVVFLTSEREAERTEARIAGAFLEAWKFEIRVMVRSLTRWRALVAHNPFTEEVRDGAKVSLACLTEPPAAKRLALLDGVIAGGERWHCSGADLYLSLPNGTGRSKLAASIERLLQVPATLRNWNTVQKLLELGETLERA